MIRVAIVDTLDGIHVARDGCLTVVCMPAVMPFCDVYEQGTALYTDEEAATFRAHYGVAAANKASGWADVLPSLVCPCHTPAPLRLAPWPPCPLHDVQRIPVSVVEVAERILGP